MSKFYVGDKVIGNVKATKRYSITKEGWTGIVEDVLSEEIVVLGTDGSGRFWVRPDCFDLVKTELKFKVNDQKIVITTDGKITTAVLYDGKKRIKNAKAICSPTDEFDFSIGAALALERLMGNPKATLPEEKSDWDKFFAGEIVFRMTDDKYDAFLTQLEQKAPTLRWAGGRKPTEYKPMMPSCYFRIDDDVLVFGCNDSRYEVVRWIDDELLNCRIRIIDGRGNCCDLKDGKTYTIKNGEIIDGGGRIYLPSIGKLRNFDDLKYYFSPDKERYSIPHSDGLSHFSYKGVEYEVLPDAIDWNMFAHGKLKVKVNKENFDKFMSQCYQRNFKWADNEKVNPWEDFESLDGPVKMFAEILGAVPGEYIWISFDDKDDTMKWSAEHDEDVDEYEFI